MMGGTIYGNGNIDQCNNLCEYNIWCDPEGAKILFDSGIPIVVVSADLTNIDVYDDEIINKVKNLGNKFSEMVLKLWAGSRATWNNLTAHDPHIIIYILMKKLFKTKETKIDVNITPEDNLNYGVLKEVPCKGKECNVIYVEGLNNDEDRKKYWQEFIDILDFKRLEKKFKIKKIS